MVSALWNFQSHRIYSNHHLIESDELTGPSLLRWNRIGNYDR